MGFYSYEATVPSIRIPTALRTTTVATAVEQDTTNDNRRRRIIIGVKGEVVNSVSYGNRSQFPYYSVYIESLH